MNTRTLVSAIVVMSVITILMAIADYSSYTQRKTEYDTSIQLMTTYMDFNTELRSFVYHTRTEPEEQKISPEWTKTFVEHCNTINPLFKTNIDSLTNRTLASAQTFCKQVNYTATNAQLTKLINIDVLPNYELYLKLSRL